MLRLRRIPIDTFGENVAYIHKNCSQYKADDINVATKVEIHGGINPVYASLVVTDDHNLLKPDELGLGIQAFKQINMPEGADVSIAPSPPPPSIEAVRRKISGNILTPGEYKAVINDIASNRYSKMEVASFLVANGTFMTTPELLALTEALAGDENHLIWDDEDIITDVHCVGGLPGNRTDLVVTPIVAAYGLTIPKTATRGITSSSGTIDAMEVLAKVDLSPRKVTNIVTEHKGCIAWKKSLGIAPADDILLSVEKAIGMSMQQQMIASILSSKIAAGVTNLLVDIPVGAHTKVRNMPEAMKLRKNFEYVAGMLAMEIDVVVTDGSEPVGQGIGPVLEARDVMKVLRCKSDAPQDLREKSLFLAGRVLEFDPHMKGGQGYHIAREILDSGKALEMMNRIIHAQGRASPPILGHLTRDITASESGLIEEVNNERISRIASLAGSPQDKGAGIDLIKKVGDTVEQGEVLYRIHASNPTDFAFANGVAEGYSGYDISRRKTATYDR